MLQKFSNNLLPLALDRRGIQPRCHILIFLFLITSLTLSAQIGGRYAFDGAALPTHARATAMGGALINPLDDDVNMAQQNPALTDSIYHKQVAFNHNFHFSGISNGNVAYGRYLHKYKIATHFALQYVSFGTFDQTNEVGSRLGEFSAGEIALTIGAGRQMNERIRVGANVKVLTGNYEAYNNLGLGLDLGVHYQKNETTSWALVLKNIGGELAPIVDDRRSLPLDLQLGFYKRLAHLPFRLSIIGHHLQEPYIRYDDPATDITTDISGNQTFKSNFSKNIDNLFRHIILGGEFMIGKKEQFRLRFGYNHLRRQELKLTTFQSRGGFSMGFGFNIKRFKLDYGRGIYHLAGAVNHLSFRYHIGKFNDKI